MEASPDTRGGDRPTDAALQQPNAPFSRFTRDRLAEIDSGLQAADWGYFGPNSVAWKIHSHPAIVIGGFRALMIQSLHPLAMAGIAQFSDFKTDPLKRFRRTAQYVHSVVFSDTETVDKVAGRVRRIHDQVQGVDPVTGKDFSANDPETLLWVHCAEAHSFLAAYRTFVQPLTDEEQDQYLREYVAAAELVGIPREMVPSSRDEYREYFIHMQPSLCSSQQAAETIRFVARPNLRLVPAKEWPFAINLKWAGHAAVTLMPRSLRQMAGLPNPGPREWALRRWTAANAKAMDRALNFDSVAGAFDQLAQKKLGTGPVPRLRD